MKHQFGPMASPPGIVCPSGTNNNGVPRPTVWPPTSPALTALGQRRRGQCQIRMGASANIIGHDISRGAQCHQFRQRRRGVPIVDGCHTREHRRQQLSGTSALSAVPSVPQVAERRRFSSIKHRAQYRPFLTTQKPSSRAAPSHFPVNTRNGVNISGPASAGTIVAMDLHRHRTPQGALAAGGKW